MRIDKRSFDETATAIGGRRGGVVGIGDGRRFAVAADGLGELAVYRVQGELDRLLANIVSAGSIGFVLDLPSLKKRSRTKSNGRCIGASVVPRLENPSLFDLERSSFDDACRGRGKSGTKRSSQAIAARTSSRMYQP